MVRWIVIILAALLGLSTLFTACSGIYGSVWFVCLWGCVAIALSVAVVRHRLYCRPSLLLLHMSLLFVLAGGFVTWLTAFNGTLTLEPGVTVRHMTASSGSAVELPFSVRLDSLVIDYYAGHELPRDYRSCLTVDGARTLCVSMNHIADIDGYRLYQTSCDTRGGSVLTVVRDLWGIRLTYAGYALFVVGGLICLVSRHGRFRKLLRSAVVAVLPVLGVPDLMAVDTISEDMADALAETQVVYKGRVVPYYTVAREFTVKVTGRVDPGGLSPVRFMASVAAFPDDWNQVEFILVKDRKLQRMLGLDGRYVSPAGMFAADGTYRLASLYRGGSESIDRAVLDADERFELLLMLRGGTLWSEVADSRQLRSRASLLLEIWYYRLAPCRWLFVAAFVLSVAAIVALVFRRRISGVWTAGMVLLLLWIAAYAVRWLIAERIPLASGGEVLEFAAILLLAMAVAVGRRCIILFVAGVMMAAFAGLVSWISDSNPVVTALVPVLVSPWLSAHVATVMASYAILSLTLPVAVTGLFARSSGIRCQCRCWLELLTIPGVLLLGIGILLGAMWANVSWGHYWAWDPKETWALITMTLYVLPIHSACRFRGRNSCFVYYIIVFLSIPVTYYGVNFLASMHAYT